VDKVTKTQNHDGSFEISKLITDNIGVTTTENIHSLVRIKDERVKKLDTKTWNTFITLAYCNKVLGKHEAKWKVQNEKAREWLHNQIKDDKLEKEILESCEKVVVEKVSETTKEQPSLFGWVGQIFDDKDTKVQVKPDTKGKGKEVLPEEKKPEAGFISNIAESIKSTAIELGKHSVKSTTTKDDVKTVVSKQKDDGSIEVSETICKQLDAPSEEKIVNTVQKYVTTEKLKDAKPSWITTSVNISYLKNLADKHEGEWKEKYDKARQYLAKEINNPQVEEELMKASDKFVVDQSTRKVIKDKKKAAVLAIRSKTSEETVNTALSTQNDDGSFEIHETITKELDNTSNDLIKKAQSYVKSDKIKPEKRESIFKTAITLGYLNTAMDNPTKELAEKYNKAREYLSSQIGDAKLEEEIIKSSSKVIIDKGSEKVQKQSRIAALEEVKQSTTPEATQAVVSKQKDDGSFEVNEEIADKLSTSSDSLVTSVTTYTKNDKLKTINPLIWSTAISMQYLKNTASQYEGDWADKYKKARNYLRTQINDESLEKELLETSDKYVLDSVTRKLVKQKEEKALKIRILEFDEDTKKATYSYLIEKFNVDDVRSICSSQGNDGLITLHKIIIERLKINNTDNSITSIKSFVSNQRLRACKDTVFETALTIYILRHVLVEYKNEWSTVCERADKWLKEQLGGDKKLEAELLSACEQYLIEETITHLNSKVVVTQDVETIHKVTLEVSDETRQTVFKYLQSRAIIDDAHVLTKSQHGDGSFALHHSIIEHLQIPSTDESIKGLVRYVGQKGLKECDKSIWQTAFVITYLRIVLVEFEKEWSVACDKAKKCVSKQLGNSKLEEELYKACDQYLIEKAVELYNSPSLEVSVVRLEVDDETRNAVFDGLKSHAKVEDARNICKSQTKNHSFILHKIISDQLKITSSEDAVESLKSYVGSLRLRRLDKSIWISAFVVTYFKVVLVEHKSEWSAACDRTKPWISQQVHNAELENELYSACEQYLIKQGCEFLNSQTTITTEVTKRMSHSVAIGSDGGVLTQKDAYLNSELIVVGAAARAKCKVKLESAQNKTLEDVSKATDLAVKYAEDEVNRLFAVNVTHHNKDDVLLRARRATKFLMDEYYKPGEDCC
ncbi:9818_t:CDS:2, partial [Funneliformis mosseae]